ncbi:hypothetical protein FNV43_RR11486 [Rhamnella rubrinervis]|uniref:DUF3741 domain-containing protein n=1 Tax=Rhamnella rubrinervis TaxID=2594499 RepID=A0A8K0H5S8_9ROSA|nr:hypothetical protein FNV43_RR11486 [Rhamnella rubrinervis]
MSASQTSNRSNQMAIDAYSYSKQNYRGSRDSRTREMIGSRTGSSHNRSSGSNRSSFVGEASKQIVTHGRGQSLAQIDLSTALAFAIENGGKLRRTDSSSRSSMLGFLQQIGRSSIDFGKLERNSIVVDRHRPSTSSFPTFSHLQIEEISKGAQKLNQILRACSNGLNFDRYSIEIGKQLMKGAMDLEDSLMMLVNLQEASEYMINPRKKNQIKLLDDDEDDEDDMGSVAEQWQLDLPRFSFDKPSRWRIQELDKTVHKQRLPAPNSAVGTKSNREKQAVITSSRSVSHSRSFSYGSEVKSITTNTDNKNRLCSSESKTEKARIPNVIAKLMGLDEIPENEKPRNSTNKDSNLKQKSEGKAIQKTTQESTKLAGLKTKSIENLASPKKQKVIDANKNAEFQNSAFVMQTGKNLPAHVSYEVVVPDEKSSRKNLQGIKGLTRSEKATIKYKQETDISQFKHNTGSRMGKQEKERKQDNKKLEEPKGTEKAETKELTLKNLLPQVEIRANNSSGAAPILQERSGFKESILQVENNHASKLLPSNQKKSQNNLELQQPFTLQKQEAEEEKQRGRGREQQTAKQILPVRKQKGSEMASKSLSKPVRDTINLQKKHPHINQAKLDKNSLKKPTNTKQYEGFPNGKRHYDLVRDKSSPEFDIHMKDSMSWNPEQNLSPRDPESESGKQNAHILPVMEEKPVHGAVLHKAKVTKVQKNESFRRIDEVVAKRNGTLNNLARSMKHQSSILEEVKHRMNENHSSYDGGEHVRATRSGEAEPRIVKSNGTTTRSQPLNLAKQLQKEPEQASTLYSPSENESKSLREPQTLASSDTCKNMIPKDQQDQAPVYGDQESKCCADVSDELLGIHEDSTDTSYQSQLKHQKIIKPSKQELLTETENQLKQILIKSQLFVNTAEALFELDIPIGILHASGQDHQQEDSKLILDCAHELMRRKGRRQEFIVHPCVTKSISFIMIKTFDGLVKKLHKDFEKLKFFGRSGACECDVEEYLPRMLEIDVHSKEPDLNCMWDLGWSETMFASTEIDEVVRDLEVHLLNALLDDITRDLFLN